MKLHRSPYHSPPEAYRHGKPLKLARVSPSYRQKWPVYAAQWDAAELTRQAVTQATCERLIAAKDRYRKISAATGVPWHMVAALHNRESNQSWSRSLAQGDRWDRVSVHVPAGRGPFASFEEAAVDALATLKGYHKIIDWRLEKILYYCEVYNGWVYHWRGLPSPYLWAATTQQARGKFIADGKFDAHTMDQQLGCAALLKCMAAMDSSIKFVREE
jgi:lysozyme family protein